MRTLFRECTRHDEAPDTIAATGAVMDNYERATTSTFQVNLPLTSDKGMIDAGFANYTYKNAIIFNDDGVPTNRTYFLNLAKFVRLVVREGRNAEIADLVKSRDRDDLVSFVLWAGNLVFKNLARNGLLFNADTFS